MEAAVLFLILSKQLTMEGERELGGQTGPPWLNTPQKPPGYSLTVFS